MAEVAQPGDRVFVGFCGEKVKYCSNIKHIKQRQLKWLKSS